MATIYQAPGVYIEEVPSAVKPIAGVGTSTAGFVGSIGSGLTMPTVPGSDTTYPEPTLGVAVLVTNWSAFETKFGPVQAANRYLAHAVYGFFQNGGTRCWVVGYAGTTSGRKRSGDADTAAVTFEAALDALKSKDEVAVVAAPSGPGTSATDLEDQHGKLVAHCELMEDRVAILDCPDEMASGANFDAAGVGLKAESSRGFAAYYFPWIEVANPETGDDQGPRIHVPPSGHIAGIYARSDTQRGVHKSPANEIVSGATDLKYSLSKVEHGPLNAAGVNVIRDFNGTIKVYGARSVSNDPEWTYIATRRLYNFVKESIEDGTQWMVFEPNNPDLWAKIRRNVSAFLSTVWDSGALFGLSEDEAFYVRCDDETNSPETQALGQVITEIGLAVTKPAEFVVFRISQSAGQS